MFDSEYEKELKDLGLTPKQIKEALTEAKASKEKLAETEGKLTTLSTEFETTKGNFAAVKTKLDELEANARKPKNNDPPPAKTDFIDDGDKAFNERFMEQAAPITNLAFQGAKNVARMSAKLSLQGKKLKTPNGDISLVNLWDRWSAELDEAEKGMMQSNALALQYEKTWLNLFEYIKGQHVEELMSKTNDFIESAAGHRDGKVIDDKQPDKLNDEEARVAARMARYGKGVTAEKIMETRKKMTFVGEAS
jgi:DNA-binding transcriptional MerR regulator